MDWQYIVTSLLEKMTQQDLAEKAGCSQPFISILASGKQGKQGRINYKTASKLVALCTIYGIQTQKNEKTPEAG